MSGHSKWATTKHKKAVIDARRGKMFAKLIKNIEVAARTGGGDPDGNPTLYDAIQKAKKSSVPNDNIDRAVKRGSGADGGGADYQTITYEGYGPNGVAVLVECLTDNRNRAATEVRLAMTRNGGTMADPGSVAYLFTRKGVVIVPKNGLTEDDVLLAVLDAGAEEVNDLGDSYEVVSEATDLVPVRTALRRRRHRVRLGGPDVPPLSLQGAAGRRRRPQGVQADRRARGQRRGAERLRQLRRVRRSCSRRSTPEACPARRRRGPAGRRPPGGQSGVPAARNCRCPVLRLPTDEPRHPHPCFQGHSAAGHAPGRRAPPAPARRPLPGLPGVLRAARGELPHRARGSRPTPSTASRRCSSTCCVTSADAPRGRVRRRARRSAPSGSPTTRRTGPPPRTTSAARST